MARRIKLVWGRAEKRETPADPTAGCKKAKAFAELDLSGKGAKEFKEVKDEAGNVTDFRDLVIKGYLSTFRATTEADRDGDYVEEGAFADSIARAKSKSPVPLQINHSRRVEDNIGRFVVLREDARGLYVEASVTNSPDKRDVRFKIAEGHLNTLSMGGIFHYKEDGRGIFKVDLYEGSVVTIPANQDAIFAAN